MFLHWSRSSYFVQCLAFCVFNSVKFCFQFCQFLASTVAALHSYRLFRQFAGSPEQNLASVRIKIDEFQFFIKFVDIYDVLISF